MALMQHRLLLLLWAWTFLANAQVATVSCPAKGDGLHIQYEPLDGPPRKTTAPKPGVIHTVDFGSLVRPKTCPGQGPCLITKLLESKTFCKVDGVGFGMTFRPVPANANRQGVCGAMIGGEVAILRNGIEFLKSTEFEPKLCLDETKPFISDVRIRPGSEHAELTWRPR